MNPKKHDIVAIDVSKRTLQLHCENEQAALPNDRGGFESIAKIAGKLPNALVVCEPTGGYERLLIQAMQARGVPCALANATQTRAFAMSQGVKAKNDPIDARMIHRFAQQRNLQPRAVPDATRQLVAELLDRRTQLSDHMASEKARLDKCSKVAAKSIAKIIRVLEKEIVLIEAKIFKAIAVDPRASRQVKAMLEVTGVGKVTAWSVLAYLPELASLSRGKLVALVGLAPYDRDSGAYKGKRSISGGKAKVRGPLFMAATSGKTHNEHLKAFYQRLQAKGKPYKVCIVARVRKLIIHLQSIIKNHSHPIACI
jgi:transposase